MPTKPSSHHADLLLELLELTSLGAMPAEQAARQLRRAHLYTRLARRAASGLEMLEAEGLVESTSDGDQVFYRTTPSGLATLERHGRFPGGAAVLFTDIVASTELIAEFGEDGAHERRQRHFSLLRAAVAAHCGREVKSLGDGLMVIFADPAAAAACAVAMQRSVAGDSDRLGLRIGLHAGELLREGNDFFGTTVIVARRLCEVAEAGQIVASDELLALNEDEPAAAQSIGAVALKGLDEPVCASELLWSPGGETAGRPARSRFLRRPTSIAMAW
ncbi:MAG: adenylate/guanylate cyclase domain-containing protein [Actinobacteria bacterium]|nr:adenylate/guanylate cyclase domain-containing protein [Actinomycetota bacterium]